MKSSNPKSDIRHPKSSSVPWQGSELRHFWALVHKMPDGGTWVPEQLVMLGGKYLRDLTRSEWTRLLWRARRHADPQNDCSEEQWDKIKWLQGQLGWTDKHLTNYILKFGHIDHINWLCGVTATKIIVGMQMIVDWQGRKSVIEEGESR